MTVEKTEAIILSAGRPVATCTTALRGGDHCCYGELLPGGDLHQYGTGTISRAKKWMGDDELLMSIPARSVNQGGGGSI